MIPSDLPLSVLASRSIRIGRMIPGRRVVKDGMRIGLILQSREEADGRLRRSPEAAAGGLGLGALF